MIFQEVQHVKLEISEILPRGRDAGCGLPRVDIGLLAIVTSDDVREGIIKARLVVEKVKAYFPHILSVHLFLIDFSDEQRFRPIFFYFLNRPFEEVRRNKFHHVTAEAVDTL